MSISQRNNPELFYSFDDQAREVCFKRHDMPTPWINYLTNGTFHTMLSQAGGGLAFYRSPQIWRITRYRFFHLPTDRSGPYLYIRDRETGQYWSPTFEPAALRPESWESAHGLGYSRFVARRDGIGAELTYFVGPLENCLIWNLKLTNHSASARQLDLFAYVELGMMEFMRELQWQCYNKHQVSVRYLSDAGALVYRYGVEMQPKPAETPLVYFTADRIPDGFDGDRDEFVGSYRSEANPLAVEQGACTNSTLMGGDPCAALQWGLRLEPGQSQTINVFLGTAMTEADIRTATSHCRQEGFVEKSLAAVKTQWGQYLEKFSCQLPDADAQRMINIWNPYQAHRNFLYSRNISYYATGTFRGVGFRDTSQDVLAAIPFDLPAARDKLRLLLSQQYADGHANHYFFPVEGWPPVTSIHSDDHLWPIWAVWSVVMEEGDTRFLHEQVAFVDGGCASVYEHLRRAVEFTRKHLGERGFPLMLRSDWNDQLFRVCREGRGESIWTGMQLGTMLPMLAQLARLLGREDDAADYERFFEQQKRLVNDLAWDGRWFRRAIMDDGRYLGTQAHDQARIWLNAQTWAVISGMAEGERGRMAMDSVQELLDTDLGIRKIHPSITDFPDPQDPLTNYNPGTGENGAVFCHANTWAIMAECLLGRPERAWKYYHQLIPAVAMKRAGLWRYKAEPYVYVSNLFGPESDKFGLANVSWLTGTAAWMYIAATQYLLGVRPQWGGLLIDPCIPPAWPQVHVQREFRGCRYDIHIHNTTGRGHGVDKLLVDGRPVTGPVINHQPGRREARVEVHMR